MISAAKAKGIILKNIKIKKPQRAPLSGALDLVLARDIKAANSLPLFSNSAMDGFAVKSKDTKSASEEMSVKLRVVGDLPAGFYSRRSLKHGEAIRIMTGAPLPRGADSVVMVENTKSDGKYVEIFKAARRGENVRQKGEDVKTGEVVLKKGAVVTPQRIGMLAALGFKEVLAYPKIKVSILATGEELIRPGEKLRPGKIRDANSYILSSLVTTLGAEAVELGIVKDDLKEIGRKIKQGLKSDMLLISGGVSVGDYDYVKVALDNLGIKRLFWKVAIKPGKPIVFGKVKNKPVFGVPGNPVSAFICFTEFIAPAILKAMGKDYSDIYASAILGRDIRKEKGKKYFMSAVLSDRNGKCYVTPIMPQNSAMLRPLSQANAILVLDEGSNCIKSGAEVKVKVL